MKSIALTEPEKLPLARCLTEGAEPPQSRPKWHFILV